MTLQASGINYWPRTLTSGQQASAFGNASLVYDSATDRLAYVGRAYFTDSIAKIYFRTGTVTTGCTIEARVEGVTNGRPSGALLAANTNGTVVVADSDDNAWKTVTLTAAASLTPGTEFAIVMVVSSGTPNMNFSAANTVFNAFSGHYPMLLQDTGAGTWAAVVSFFAWIVELITAGVVPFPGLLPVDSGAIATYNSGSSPDEKMLHFVCPKKCRAIGVRVIMANIAAGADYTVSLWPASSTTDGDALAQVAMDGDATISATQDGSMDIFFAAAVTITAGTTYYIGVRADTANNIAVVELLVPAAISNAIRGFPIPANGEVYKAARTWTAGSAGSISPTTTTLLLAYLITDQEDDGVSAGGGGMRLAGHGGLAA